MSLFDIPQHSIVITASARQKKDILRQISLDASDGLLPTVMTMDELVLQGHPNPTPILEGLEKACVYQATTLLPPSDIEKNISQSPAFIDHSYRTLKYHHRHGLAIHGATPQIHTFLQHSSDAILSLQVPSMSHYYAQCAQTPECLDTLIFDRDLILWGFFDPSYNQTQILTYLRAKSRSVSEPTPPTPLPAQMVSRLISCHSAFDECHWIAQELYNSHSPSTAVVLPDMGASFQRLSDIFLAYNIPFYTPFGTPLSPTPAAQALLLAFEVIQKGYSDVSWGRFFRLPNVASVRAIYDGVIRDCVHAMGGASDCSSFVSYCRDLLGLLDFPSTPAAFVSLMDALKEFERHYRQPSDWMDVLALVIQNAPVRGFESNGVAVMGIRESYATSFESVFILHLNDNKWFDFDSGFRLLDPSQYPENTLPNVAAHQEETIKLLESLGGCSRHVTGIYAQEDDNGPLSPLSILSSECLTQTEEMGRLHDRRLSGFMDDLSSDIAGHVDIISKLFPAPGAQLKVVSGNKNGSSVLPHRFFEGKSFSPTSLERYHDCPRQYFYHHLLGLRPDSDDAMRAYSDWGNLVHQIMADGFAKRDNPSHDDMRRSAELVLSESSDGSVIWDVFRNFLFGTDDFDGVLSQFMGGWKEYLAGATPLHLETVFKQQFDLADSGTPVYLEGRVDAVFKLSDGSTVVMDYKTGKELPTAGKLKSFQSIQLPFYLWLLENQETPVAVSGGVYGHAFRPWHVGIKSPLYSNPKNSPVPTSRGGIDWGSFRNEFVEHIQTQLKQLISGDMSVSSGRVMDAPDVCNLCGFRRVCTYEKRFEAIR